MAKPIVLVASCSETPTTNIIKEIFGQEDCPTPERIIEDVTGYPWNIKTKYYTAEIVLSSAPSKTIGDESFAQRVEAFMVHIDTTHIESFENMKLWLPFIKQLEPEIKLLLCDICKNGDAVGRLTAWQWCLDNSFELIELYPEEEETDDDIEDDFQETVGIERVIQALHSHTWSNLVMEDNPNFRSNYMSDMMEEYSQSDGSDTAEQSSASHSQTQSSSLQHLQTLDTHKESKQTFDSVHTELNCDRVELSDVTQGACSVDIEGKTSKGKTSEEKTSGDKTIGDKTSEDETSGVSSNKPQSQQAPSTIDSLLGDNQAASSDATDKEEESFEKMFENFSLMKEKADALPFEERKKYAEKVAIDFWKAIGGDDTEIDGLDSDVDSEN